jgi:serine/threonine protein kinase
VNHVHLCPVYAAGSNEAGSYAVLEWNGGVTFADRLEAGETVPVEEFLPNAAGLAAGLAALHAAGTTHGAVDASAIVYSPAHPAKLGAFGRPTTDASERADVRSLAEALRIAATGQGAAGLYPSEVTEGMPEAVDRALLAAEHGQLDATGLAAALRASRATPPAPPGRTWTWRWLIPAAALFALAGILAAIGLSLEVDPDSPFLFPATPPNTVEPRPSPSVVTTVPVAPDVRVLAGEVASYDPYGDGRENDESLPLISDGDPDTMWQTERYFNAMDRAKPGVGIVFTPVSPPTGVEVLGSSETRFTLEWAPAIPEDPGGWQRVTAGTILDGRSRLQLPRRDGGAWLLWLTSLPERDDGEYFYSDLNEVRFLGGT